MDNETATPIGTIGFAGIRALGRGVLRDTAYLLPGLLIDTVKFSLLLTLFCVGVGTVIIWVGIPILVFTLLLGHQFANFELLRLRPLGIEPKKLSARFGGATVVKRKLGILRSGRHWRELLHGIFIFPVTVVTWSISISWWAVVLAGATGWIWIPIQDRAFPQSLGLVDLLHLPILEQVLHFALAVVFAITLPWVLRGCTLVHIALANALLLPTNAELEAEIAKLSRTREQLDAAEVLSRRRLEHDIHDGPQQKLIRLGMDLATAQRRLDEGDVAAASSALREARSLTDATISELRALSRGFAPPILKDRGLDAALSALCAQSVIPTRLTANLADAKTLPESIAAAAYFAVAEGLSNAAKHSQASEILVYAQLEPQELIITICDNGRGGAEIVPDHGLAGLRDRIEGHNGSISLDSIADSGTRVTVKLPR
ncbi:MAG: sensor domain-containing protein [Propionibacteriaceae bacterium]|jgi:signal transduction histidine kinase|nr:sensor domain-containing protein [Propionibacteriaceae bacterium]